ncbi:transposase [Streptomyces sp. NPDC047000]|uniref:transposase n=1 Tax=Streptomyces sp. NPDC047000 TaxID=3155474 RepID=UPI0033C973ED
MSERKSCKTDVSDERWAPVEPVITAWKAAHPSVSGCQGRYAMREIVNALLYQGRTGCRWELLPHDFPPPGAVKHYFCTWRDDGIYQMHSRPAALAGAGNGAPEGGPEHGGARHPERARGGWGARGVDGVVIQQKNTGPQARPGR